MLYRLLHGHDALDVLLLLVTVNGTTQDELEEAAQLPRVYRLTERVHIRHVEVIDVLVEHLQGNKHKGHVNIQIQLITSITPVIQDIIPVECLYMGPQILERATASLFREDSVSLCHFLYIQELIEKSQWVDFISNFTVSVGF